MPSKVNTEPLSESTFLILISLSGEPRHGYAIMKSVEELSKSRVILSTGTLYGAIKRLLADGWIQRVELPEDREGSDTRERKSYALTRRGRLELNAEIRRLGELIEIAQRLCLPGDAHA